MHISIVLSFVYYWISKSHAIHLRMTDKSSTTDVESMLGTGQEPKSPDVELEAIQKLPTRARNPWHMTEELLARKQREEEAGEKLRLGVTWNNLTVKGISSDATFNENVVSQFYPFHRDGKSAPKKTIIDNSFGCVKPGEMLLVINLSPYSSLLGSHGSSLTSLLPRIYYLDPYNSS